MTAVTQFNKYLTSIGFNNFGVQKSKLLIPSHYKTSIGDHFIPSAIHVCFFGGSGTKDGDLGCVTFSYHGKYRNYRCRNTDDRPEVFKKAFVPKSAKEAITQFEIWHKEAMQEILTWKKVM